MHEPYPPNRADDASDLDPSDAFESADFVFGDEAEAAEPPRRSLRRRAVSWLLSLALISVVLLGVRVVGASVYQPESWLPAAPAWPVERGLLGYNQPALNELQTALDLAGDDPVLTLADGDIYRLGLPRKLADRLFGKRNETATVFSATTATGAELRVLALRGEDAPPLFALDVSRRGRPQDGLVGNFVGLPLADDDSLPISRLNAALAALLPEVDAADARAVSADDFTVFGPYERGRSEVLARRIEANYVLDHIVDALEVGHADVSIAAPVFLVRPAPERGRTRGLYQSGLRLVQEPLGESSETAVLAHELTHAYIGRVLDAPGDVLAEAADYFETAHPRLYGEVVNDLYEQLDRRGRAEEALAFIVGSVAAGDPKTVAAALLLQNRGYLQVSEAVLASDIDLLIELGLLPACMAPAGVGHTGMEIDFPYYEAARAACG